MRKKIRCFNLVNEIKDFEFNSFEEFENWVDDGAKIDDDQSFTPENLENILNKLEEEHDVEVIQVVTNVTDSITGEIKLEDFIAITRER